MDRAKEIFQHVSWISFSVFGDQLGLIHDPTKGILTERAQGVCDIETTRTLEQTRVRYPKSCTWVPEGRIVWCTGTGIATSYLIQAKSVGVRSGRVS